MTNNSKSICVVGLQWGDEGKGKIVDYLSADADYVIRFNGGNNAGHTVVLGDKTYKFHHIPSGAVAGKKLLIAQGCVINPKILLEEIKLLSSNKISVNLMIDPRVHIVMPYHQLLDAATEEWKGKNATGSLKLGIGYCYEDKNNRLGIRFEDLIDKKILSQKIKTNFPLKKAVIEKVYGKKVTLSVPDIIKEYFTYAILLKKYLGDVAQKVDSVIAKKHLLFETAHGTFLDPAFGTYPYTVAPHAIAGGLFTGVGIGPMNIDVIGVVKAYTTRVGNGPFLTELEGESGKILQKRGQEIGTTSGRVRRCGWLDLTMLRSAVKLNNVKSIALTKLDVLSAFSEIKVATHYIFHGEKYRYFPSQMNTLASNRPLFKSFKGWKSDISKNIKFKDLPKNCRIYLDFISRELGVRIKYISVGPDRNSIIEN